MTGQFEPIDTFDCTVRVKKSKTSHLLVKRKSLLGIAFIVSGYSAFAWGDAIAKWLGPSFGAMVTVFYMTVFLLGALLAVSPWLGGMRAAVTTPRILQHTIRGSLFALALVLFIYGVQHMVLAEAYTLLFTMPFIASLLAVPLLGERIKPWRWAVMAIGFTGVLIVLRPGATTLSAAASCILAAAFIFANFDIMTRKIGKDEAWLAFALYPALMTVLLTGAYLAASGSFTLPSLSFVPAFAIAGAAHLAGSLLTARGYTLAPISLASPFQYTQLLWGILLGAAIFGEWPDHWTMAGGACLIAAGLFSIFLKREPL